MATKTRTSVLSVQDSTGAWRCIGHVDCPTHERPNKVGAHGCECCKEADMEKRYAVEVTYRAKGQAEVTRYLMQGDAMRIFPTRETAEHYVAAMTSMGANLKVVEIR